MPISCNFIELETLCPALGATRQVSFRTLQQQYGDGYMARRQAGLNPLNITWQVSTPPMTIENCQAFEEELIANGTKAYSWTPPFETETSTWVLDPVVWDWNFDTGNIASISFTLRRWYS